MTENMKRVIECDTEKQLHVLIKELSEDKVRNEEEIMVAVSQIKAIRHWKSLSCVR